MANPAFRLHATGCGLADLIQGDVDFQSDRLAPYRSRRPGDGGLEMGTVVLQEDLVHFAGRPWEAILADLAPSQAVEFQPGGPALVASALASQLLRPSKVPVTFYGLSGDDNASSRLRWLLAQTPWISTVSASARAGLRSPGCGAIRGRKAATGIGSSSINPGRFSRIRKSWGRVSSRPR